MDQVKSEQILAAAGRTATQWSGDWKIYLDEVQRLTGLTFEQACLFDMMCTLRDMGQHTKEAQAEWRQHMRDEHGGEGETWQ